MGNESLERSDITSIIENQLVEELIDGLEMRPGRIDDDVLLLNTGLWQLILLLQNRKRAEDVLHDHLEQFIKVRDDGVDDHVLVREHLRELGEIGLPFCLDELGGYEAV